LLFAACVSILRRARRKIEIQKREITTLPQAYRGMFVSPTLMFAR